MSSEACAEELETLLAIFLDDIQVTKNDDLDNVIVTIVLFPSTGDDSESKYVTLTLEILLPKFYPDELPLITFRNPRGLSEEMLDKLAIRMTKKCEEIQGCSMVFELIDMGKEFLTENNRPASECPICLLSFTEFDVFFRPSCFHHVHSFCLGKYLYSVKQSWANEDQLPNESTSKNSYCCPVCRLEFVEGPFEEMDIQKFLTSPPPSEDTEDTLLEACVPKDWLGKKETLDRLFAKQKSQGGIIDLSGRDKKLLVISSPNRVGVELAEGTNNSSSIEETSTSSLSSNQSDISSSVRNPSCRLSSGTTPTPAGTTTKPRQNRQQQQQHPQQTSRHPPPPLASNSSEPSTKNPVSDQRASHKDPRGPSGSHYRHRRRL